jgi:hypothetical protein
MFEMPMARFGLTKRQRLFGICGVGAFFISAYLGALWYTWLILLGLTVVLSLFQDMERSNQLKAFALSCKLVFLGDALPKSFPMQRTSACSGHSIRNAVTGTSNSRDILLFDCSLGRGKRRFRRTVVAGRGSVAEFGWAGFGPDLEAEQVGDWAVVYGSRRLLALNEIETLLSEFGRCSPAIALRP